MADKIIAEIELQGLQGFNNEINEAVKAADKLENNVNDAGKNMSNTFYKIGVSVQSLQTQLKKSKEDLKNVSLEIKSLKDAGDTGSNELKALEERFKQITTQVGNLQESIDNFPPSLKAKLIEAKAELSNVILEMNRLKDAGDTGSNELKALEERFKQIVEESGRLNDAIGDASKSISNAGSDTRGLDRAIRTLTLGSNAFQLIEGSAALFGVENENLQRTLVRLNAVMAITNALQQIQEELTKEDTVATKALTIVKTIYARAVGFAAAQTKLFQLALAGLGIGLLIAAIATLAANWEKVKKALGFATDEQERNNKALEYANKLRKIQDDRFAKEIELRRLRGEDEKKLIKEELNREQNRLDELKAKKDKEIAISSGLNKFTLEQAKKTGASQKQINDLISNKGKATIKSSTIDAIIEQEIVVEKLKNRLKELSETQNITTTTTSKLNEEIKKSTSIGLTLLREQLEEAKKDLDKVIDKEVQLGSNLVNNPNIVKAKETISGLEQKIKDIEDALNSVGKEVQTTQGIQKGFDITVDEQKSKSNIEEAINRLKKDFEKVETKGRGNAEGIGIFTIKVFGIKRSDYQSEADYRVSVAQKAFQSIADISNKITSTISQFSANTAEAESQKYEGLRARGLISEKNYQRQIAKIKNEQAKKQRRAELTQAAVNIPIAILSTFTNTQGGIVVKSIAASIAGAFAGAQLAAIAKKPIPQFYKGTRKAPSGFKWVGEKGPELLHDKGGYSILPNKESEEVAKIYNRFDVPYKKFPKDKSSNNNFDMDKIVKSLERSSYRQLKAMRDKGVYISNINELAEAIGHKKYV